MTAFKHYLLPALLIILSATMLHGQTPKVIQLIEEDSIITVSQPVLLEKRLQTMEVTKDVVAERQEETVVATDQPVVTGGYRVQVFADNNARTAKEEARSKALAIREQLPHLATYVTYEAPYWRLRVGDFRSESDAEAAAAEIKHYFPHISREVRVVRDRINK